MILRLHEVWSGLAPSNSKQGWVRFLKAKSQDTINVMDVVFECSALMYGSLLLLLD